MQGDVPASKVIYSLSRFAADEETCSLFAVSSLVDIFLSLFVVFFVINYKTWAAFLIS